jgi:hypothetical protein
MFKNVNVLHYKKPSTTSKYRLCHGERAFKKPMMKGL